MDLAHHRLTTASYRLFGWAETYCAVFSIIGTLNLSKYPNIPFPGPLGIPLICSILSISKQASFPPSRSASSVTSTAHWECVCIQQPAPRRSNAERNNGVHADGLRAEGRRRYCLVEKSMTNMSDGFISSFCTPEGARKMWLPWRMETPPPVPVTWRHSATLLFQSWANWTDVTVWRYAGMVEYLDYNCRSK